MQETAEQSSSATGAMGEHAPHLVDAVVARSQQLGVSGNQS